MPTPSPQAIAAIRAAVTDWSRDDATVLAALNDRTIANPTPQGTVPAPFTSSDLAMACSEANRPKLVNLLSGSAAPLIIANDRVHLAQGLDGLQAIGVFPAEDVAAMKAVLDATIPDPNWLPMLSWAELNLGRLAEIDDVKAARPAGTGV